MAHGVRRHMARGVCDRKMAFTTWSAAYSKMTEVPGAVRVIRGSCCGRWHVTSMTETEFAQAVADSMAAQGCTDGYNRGMMDLSTEEYLKIWEQEHGWQDTEGGEPQPRQGDAGEASLERRGDPRLAPSPAAVARRLQARSSA